MWLRFLDWAGELRGPILAAIRDGLLSGRSLCIFLARGFATVLQKFPKSWRNDRHVWISAGAAALVAVLISSSYALFSDQRAEPAKTMASAPQDPAAALAIPSEPIDKNPPPETPSPAAPPEASGPVVTPYNSEQASPSSTAEEISPPSSMEQEDASKATPQKEEDVRVTGVLRVAIRPWGLIMVDGESKGVSPPLKRLVLPQGKHKIDVVNSGFPTYTTILEVQKDRVAMISHDFR
jgi:hypothetical protein